MSKKIVRQCAKCGRVKGYSHESLTRDMPHHGISWLGDVTPITSLPAKCVCGSLDLRVVTSSQN